MKKNWTIAVAVVLVLIVIGLVYWQTRPGEPTAPTAPTGNTTTAPTPDTTPSNETTETPPKEAPTQKPATGAESSKSSTPSGSSNGKPSTKTPNQSANRPSTAQNSKTAIQQYCAGQSVSDAETKALAKQGGLVAIFQNEAALHDAYACAQTYLDHGGDIDGVDPRSDSDHLTPLLFAVQRNDPKMVNFVIDHGAALSKRGGPKNVKPYGYAVYLALQNQATNYNQVISILDSSMRDQNGS